MSDVIRALTCDGKYIEKGAILKRKCVSKEKSQCTVIEITRRDITLRTLDNEDKTVSHEYFTTHSNWSVD